MSASLDDVTDGMVADCEADHHEPHLSCPHCPTRAELRYCGRCEEEIYPHETCPDCTDEPALVVDGFGRALVAGFTGVTR